MLCVTTAGRHTTTTGRPSQMATHTWQTAPRRILPLAAAGPLVLASAPAFEESNDDREAAQERAGIGRILR
jgi:hypothetical protein